MHQSIQGKALYVVEFDTMPELPITGLTDAERTYELLMQYNGGSLYGRGTLPASGFYAKALTHALETGVITEPGKYGIYRVPGTLDYEIYTITE